MSAGADGEREHEVGARSGAVGGPGGGAGARAQAAGEAASGVLDLRIAVERDEVRRLLAGAPRKGRSPRLEEGLERHWAPAVARLRPRGAWRIVRGPDAAATGMPQPGAWAGLGLCTVGPELEGESARLAGGGDLLGALVLDAIGSAAAEAAADALNGLLCAQAAARGLFAAPRVSPGYGAWDVACQGRLLALLPAAELGIALTSGQMMVPRKSVSFAAAFAPAPPDGAETTPCERCGLTHCRHRRGPH